jgi:hypothetical protein
MAATTPTPTPVDLRLLPNPAPQIRDVSLGGILTGGGFNLFDFLFFLAGAFFLGSLLMASIEYVTSEGDPGKINSATKRITNALVGLVIVFASFVIIRIAASIFGYGDIVPF